jgi:hypothetical protein
VLSNLLIDYFLFVQCISVIWFILLNYIHQNCMNQDNFNSFLINLVLFCTFHCNKFVNRLFLNMLYEFGDQCFLSKSYTLWTFILLLWLRNWDSVQEAYLRIHQRNQSWTESYLLFHKFSHVIFCKFQLFFWINLCLNFPMTQPYFSNLHSIVLHIFLLTIDLVHLALLSNKVPMLCLNKLQIYSYHPLKKQLKYIHLLHLKVNQ